MKYLLLIAGLLFLVHPQAVANQQKDRIGVLKTGKAHVSIIQLICAPEKFAKQQITTTGFVGVSGLPNFEARIFLSSEDLRLNRNENSFVLNKDGLELSYEILERTKGRFVFIQGVLTPVKTVSRKQSAEAVININYLQILDHTPPVASKE